MNDKKTIGTLFIHVEKIRRPRTDPCGKPEAIRSLSMTET